MLVSATAARFKFPRDPVITSIARLTDRELDRMSRDDLQDLIRLSRDVDPELRVMRALDDCETEQLREAARHAREKCQEHLLEEFRARNSLPWFSA